METGSRIRNHLFFSLISMVGLLWSTFLVSDGIWVWVSVWIILVCVGTTILVLVLRFR